MYHSQENRISLDGNDWNLAGYWPNAWRLGKSKELGQNALPIIPPCKATVPGAVQLDLLAAGEIDDINIGLNSRKAEWIEHWEWIYSKRFVIPESFAGKRVIVDFEGLDYSGAAAIDGEIIGYFEGTHMPHSFDITKFINPGTECVLSVAFDPPPTLPGQFAYTYNVEKHKPRFNYIWDWIARTVSIGIWGSVTISAYSSSRIVGFSAVTSISSMREGSNSGKLDIFVDIDNMPDDCDLKLAWTLSKKDGRANGAHIKGECELCETSTKLELCVDDIELWWPNGWGTQTTYDLDILLLHGGDVIDEKHLATGFKLAEWIMNSPGPEDARPSTLILNGRTIYLRGANWVPLSPFPGGLRAIDYRQIIALYKNMNVNLLRVWGGGILEKREFYDACDEAGIMVWQELPLSSGGCSDYPPSNQVVVDELSKIAESMVRRRCHYVSHLMWDGGNELAQGFDGRPEGRDVPVDLEHPLIAEFDRVVAKWDPGKKFIPTSGHGPRAFGNEAEFGKGVNHDVHGWWAYMGPEAHYRYYNGDDALWRSEVGVPGATSPLLMDRNSGGIAPWPPTRDNRLWLNHGAWWINWELMNAVFGLWDTEDSTQLDKYLMCSRYLQAEGYRYILEACRRRTFNCSLNTIWMGHDCYWNTSNNSVIEYDGSCKPAYSFAQRSFGKLKVSLRYERCYTEPSEDFPISVWVSSDNTDDWPEMIGGTLILKLRGTDGSEKASKSWEVEFRSNGSTRLCEPNLNVPTDASGLSFIELTLSTEKGTSKDIYIFGQKKPMPLEALRNLPDAELAYDILAHTASSLTVSITNVGCVASVMTELIPLTTPARVRLQGSAITIFPGESVVMTAQSVIEGEPLPRLGVNALNIVDSLRLSPVDL